MEVEQAIRAVVGLDATSPLSITIGTSASAPARWAANITISVHSVLETATPTNAAPLLFSLAMLHPAVIQCPQVEHHMLN